MQAMKIDVKYNDDGNVVTSLAHYDVLIGFEQTYMQKK